MYTWHMYSLGLSGQICIVCRKVLGMRRVTIYIYIYILYIYIYICVCVCMCSRSYIHAFEHFEYA